jgi:homoserine kinase
MPRDRQWIRVFAPASIANLGPGFDVLGLAIEGLGDTVAMRRVRGSPGVVVTAITGEAQGIPLDAQRNCAGRAAASVVARCAAAGAAGARLEMRIHKGVARASGLGSSAASAVGGAVAANLLLEGGLDASALLEAALDGEVIASGARHADNVAASLFGGLTIVRSHAPIDVIHLDAPEALRLVIMRPDMEIETRRARELLPLSVPLQDAVFNWANVAALVAAAARGDVGMFGRSVDDRIVEPARKQLIPGFDEVKAAALAVGAFGCSISGAGPALFAVATVEIADEVRHAMLAALRRHGVPAGHHVCAPDNRGARTLG